MALIQENSELKARLKIQEIEAEARLRVERLERRLEQLEAQLQQTRGALKEANVRNEMLSRQTSELEHRSRLLEDRSRPGGMGGMGMQGMGGMRMGRQPGSGSEESSDSGAPQRGAGAPRPFGRGPDAESRRPFDPERLNRAPQQDSPGE